MSNIQKTLDSLQPYVIGIRYLEGTPLVDVVFKEGWTVSDESKIKKVKGDNDMNYYMLFSDDENIGLDELLSSVKRTIDINVEREKKHELLKEKVNQLKVVFKNNSLEKLKNLNFTFSEDDLVPKLDDFDLDIDIDIDIVEETIEEPTVDVKTEESSKIIYSASEIDAIAEEYSEPTEIKGLDGTQYLDENGNPIEMSDEELEMIEEETRGRKNLEYLKNKNKNSKTNKIKNVELPPR